MWQGKSQQQTDQEVVARCLNGDSSAWKQLIERYQTFIFGIAVRSGLNPTDADDIFQNVCLKLCLHLQELRDHSCLKAWLGAVTRQECFRLFRRQTVESLDTLNDVPYDRETPEETVLRSERIAQVRSSIASLSAECRELLERLYCPTPLPYVTIAEELEIPLGSVGPRRARCLERLKKNLESHGF
jgi:RNA polymerase sigma factor (sigma-70 family)